MENNDFDICIITSLLFSMNYLYDARYYGNCIKTYENIFGCEKLYQFNLFEKAPILRIFQSLNEITIKENFFREKKLFEYLQQKFKRLSKDLIIEIYTSFSNHSLLYSIFRMMEIKSKKCKILKQFINTL